MSKLLIATTNAHKLQEIKELIKDLPLEVISLKDMNKTYQVEETGNKFEENALLKSQYWGEKTHLLTLAEDSGLEINALDGRPGILSARYCEGDDVDRMNKILKEMENIHKADRTARYRTIISLYDPNKKESYLFEGISEGKILPVTKGKNGFGYDPIFYSLDLKKTFAEATFKEKNKVSHRARGIAKLRAWLISRG